MKKWVIFDLLLLITFCLSAQIGLPKWIDAGPKAGYIANRIDYADSDIEAGLKDDFTVGVFGRFYLNKRLYISPEINYSRLRGEASLDTSLIMGDAEDVLNEAIKEAIIEYTEYGIIADQLANIATRSILNKVGLGNLDAELKVQTLQIPFLFGCHLGKMRKDMNISIQAGPVLNVFLDDKTILKGSFAEILGSDAVEFNMNKVNWGIQAGISLDIKRLVINFSAHYGLTNLFIGNGLKVDHDKMISHFKPYFTNCVNELIEDYSGFYPELSEVSLSESEVNAISEEFYKNLRDVDTGDLVKARRYNVMLTVGWKF